MQTPEIEIRLSDEYEEIAQLMRLFCQERHSLTVDTADLLREFAVDELTDAVRDVITQIFHDYPLGDPSLYPKAADALRRTGDASAANRMEAKGRRLFPPAETHANVPQ